MFYLGYIDGICECGFSDDFQVDFIHCLVPDLRKITNCGFYWGNLIGNVLSFVSYSRYSLRSQVLWIVTKQNGCWKGNQKVNFGSD